MEYRYLGKIKSPEDIKKLNKTDIDALCGEIRGCIIDTVSKNGGHLASNLGAVELTVALHRAFSAPQDAIIFDVGHQSYTHKLLTGRFERFGTIRTEGGLSGFMRPDESEYDPFVTGHSSNSISAAYGIYRAKRINGEDGTAVAVIGDGALTGGMAYEALNNAGGARSNFIVVLNDNKMSISRNVGALARSLTRMRNKPRYHHFKFAISRFLLAVPLVGRALNNALYRIKEAAKGLVYRNNIFTSMGFNYLGPVDGHDVGAMESLFKVAQTYTRPSLIHVITTKGKGYSYAENSPKNYHGVSPFDADVGAAVSKKETYSDIVGKTLCALARADGKICAITAAMTSGTGLANFAAEYKTRFFDVGIAEEHAVTFAAGLSKGGAKPFFAVYSTFLQRGYDQLLHDVAIAHLPIKLLVDRAGIVGEDGESHQGIFDAAYLSTIPGMTVYSPCFYNELEALIIKASCFDGPIAIRYPRGCERKNTGFKYRDEDYTVINRGGTRAAVTYGRIFANVSEAAERVGNTDVVKLNKICPIDDRLILELMKYKELYFYEEGIEKGGVFEHIAARLLENGYSGSIILKAIPNEFVPAASVEASLKKYGLDTESVINDLNGENK